MPRTRRFARTAVTVAASAAIGGATGFAASAALNQPEQPTPGAGTTAAQADELVGFQGKSVSAVDVATGVDPQQFEAAWAPIAGSTVTVSVPSGPWRLASSTFSGETFCTGPANTWCSVRIVARRPGTTDPWGEFYPRVGHGAVLDAAGSDNWEGHSLDRSKTLAPGTWSVRAEGRTSHDGVTMFVSDWHHRVELYIR